MDTDTSPTPDGDAAADGEDDTDDGGHRAPFDPAKDDDTPLGDTDQHSDADA